MWTLLDFWNCSLFAVETYETWDTEKLYMNTREAPKWNQIPLTIMTETQNPLIFDPAGNEGSLGDILCIFQGICHFLKCANRELK